MISLSIYVVSKFFYFSKLLNLRVSVRILVRPVNFQIILQAHLLEEEKASLESVNEGAQDDVAKNILSNILGPGLSELMLNDVLHRSAASAAVCFSGESRNGVVGRNSVVFSICKLPL